MPSQLRSSPAPRFQPRGIVPTHEQQLIQCARQRISLIEAGAGTAKTTTLALRVGEALRRGLDPEQILVLVFTPEAAEVFAQRLVFLGLAPRLVRRLSIQTIEQFARAQWLRWGEGEPPYHEDLAALRPFILQALEQCSERYGAQYPYLEVRTHEAAMSQFYLTQLRLKHSLALQDEDPSLTAEERADLHEVPLSDYLWTQSYEMLRLSAFDEALFRGPHDASHDLACTLIHSNDAAAALPQYRLIVVDELHDMNATTFTILRALLQHEQAYMVAAGDSDQVIYRHMGADRRYLHEHFEQHFEHVAQYQLNHSFRYGPWIALALGAFKSKRLDSALAFDSQLRVVPYAPGEQARLLLDDVQRVTRHPERNLSHCAVILRALHQSVIVENAFLMAGVPYDCHGFVPYLQRDEILFVRGLLAIAFDWQAELPTASLQAMVRALSQFGEAQLNPDEIASAQEDIGQEPGILRYFYEIRMLEKSSPTAALRNRQAIELLREQGAQGNAVHALDALCELLDIERLAKRIYLDTHQAQIIAQSIWGLRDLARAQDFSLQALHQWMVQADSQMQPEPGARARVRYRVQILCAPQAKGKEFAHVFIPLLEQGEFPRGDQHAFIEENLFYVACSRAQAELTLYVPEAAERQSPYVERLQVAQSRAQSQAQLAALQERLQRQQQPQAQPATTQRRIYLQVPYAEKDEAKALGAYWDPDRRSWYIPHWVEPEPLLKRWPRRQSKRSSP